MDRERDPDGDVQTPLEWKTQTVSDGANQRTFYYAELTENDFIKLTKKNPKRKPLYNNDRCRLEFQTKFAVKSWSIFIYE